MDPSSGSKGVPIMVQASNVSALAWYYPVWGIPLAWKKGETSLHCSMI